MLRRLGVELLESYLKLAILVMICALVFWPLLQGFFAPILRYLSRSENQPIYAKTHSKFVQHSNDRCGFLDTGIAQLAPLVLFLGVISISVMVVFLCISPPLDYLQGPYIIWLYLHAPAAFAGQVAFGVLCISMVRILVADNGGWRALGRSAAQLGWLVTGITVLSGAAWSRPIWGTYWEWDVIALGTLTVLFSFIILSKIFLGASRWILFSVFLVQCAAIMQIHYGPRIWSSLHGEPFVRSLFWLEPEFQFPLLLGVIGATLVSLGYIFSQASNYNQSLPLTPVSRKSIWISRILG